MTIFSVLSHPARILCDFDVSRSCAFVGRESCLALRLLLFPVERPLAPPRSALQAHSRPSPAPAAASQREQIEFNGK